MPVSTINVLPLATRAEGSYSLPSTAIPNNVTHIGLMARRCTTADNTIWPSESVLLDARLEFSPDNGATWFPWGAYTSGGGIASNRGQGELAEGGISQSVPAGTNRRLRGTAIITGGTLRSSVNATLVTPG